MSNHPPHVIAAHHEAGHGVGAVVLNVPIKSISIEGGTSGDGSFDTGTTWREVKAGGHWRDYAVVCELGRTVEQLMFGTEARDSWESDQQRIDQIVSTFVSDVAERGEFKLWLKRRAREITEQACLLDAVKLAALELADSNVLSGQRLHEIVREVGTR